MTDTYVSKSNQYDDGVVAKVWDHYIGDPTERTRIYRRWLVNLLKKHNCKNVIDVACGTGIDSLMLIEEGFRLTSCDASEKMIIRVLQERWERRKKVEYEDWDVQVANWLTLDKVVDKPDGGGYDALVCLGNSFANLLDFDGKQSCQKRAIKNFATMLKPGGIMIIDHRNFDSILASGKTPEKNIYYQSRCLNGISTTSTVVDGKPVKVSLDYFFDTAQINNGVDQNGVAQTNGEVPRTEKMSQSDDDADDEYKFTLDYYPHKLKDFTSLLHEGFGKRLTHTVYGDYQPQGEVETPCYFIHVVEKQS